MVAGIAASNVEGVGWRGCEVNMYLCWWYEVDKREERSKEVNKSGSKCA